MSDTRTPTEILRAARARIADTKHWTRYKAARDRHGHYVPPMSERAVRWCGAGSLNCELASCPEEAQDAVWEYIQPIVGNGGGIWMVNDLHGHKAVLRMFDQAIALAEAESAHAAE
jgi:hypothetical protein